MKYSYVTPKIEVNVNSVIIPKVSDSANPTDIVFNIGEGKFEVEGSASDLIEVSAVVPFVHFTVTVFVFKDS